MRTPAITVRLRLSAADITAITPVLRQIMAAEERAGSTEGLAPFRSTISKLSPLDGGGRVRLDHLELAACTLCVRQLQRDFNHGHRIPFSGWQSHLIRLLKKLEHYRRRARKVCEKRLGADAYWQAR